MTGVPHPGDSAEQRAAEVVVLQQLSIDLGVVLAPANVSLDGGARVEVDGLSADPPILVEIWAHQGTLRGGQPNKVTVDAMKMVFVEQATGTSYRKIFCFTDEAARKPFVGRSWRAAMLRHNGIELVVIELPEATRLNLIEAQERQYR